MKAKLLAFVVVAFVAFVLWSADAGSMPDFIRELYSFPNGDRFGHIGVYGILSVVLCLAFPRTVRLSRLSVPIASVALLAFALVEEISQTAFSSRTADVIDLLCSWIGIAIGTMVASFWISRYVPRSSGKC